MAGDSSRNAVAPYSSAHQHSLPFLIILVNYVTYIANSKLMN